jgi:farnesyl-diphosphate farnesyltransferase
MGKLGKIVEALYYPTEVAAAVQLKLGGSVRATRDESLEALALDKSLSDIDYCYEVLQKVSRSFAVVIQQLPACLRDAVCIFYLVLRGLDSVEDDMTYNVTEKVVLLRAFHEKLKDPSWAIEGVGDSADYRILLKYFPRVTRCHLALEPGFQAVIEDITKRMGNGMADFAVKTKSIDTTANYNLYCHYVAGLVGYGLSDLFSASGLEGPDLKKETKLSNSMGLFLQKTNIIRDYLEDLVAGRTWWPEEIWSKHAKTLDAFQKAPDADFSLACLNELVDDALALAPASLKYLSLLKNKEIFHFCAIPQIMAMATLSEVYNNPKVFKGVVKVRKGLSCKMMLGANDMATVGRYFNLFAQKIEAKMPSPTRKTAVLMKEVKQLTITYAGALSEKSLRVCHQLAWFVLLLCIVLSCCCSSSKQTETFSTCNILNCGAMMLSIGYLAGLFGTQYF